MKRKIKKKIIDAEMSSNAEDGNEDGPKEIKTFQDFKISEATWKGLRDQKYVYPTEIQKQTIDHGLRGRDILGAAKTGSGKTLAFLIPLLEKLYRNKWTKLDGVGAIVISPVRELALQTFNVVNKIGKYHDFSVGLVTGGKDLKFETKRMNQCNIVICTPNRLLQHLDENPLCNCNNLQILILDEADRCLETCFEETMNRIMQHLPAERQTLLFSATLTKSVQALARLSLNNPKYISVDENAEYSTPTGLVQSYIECELHDKINFLWSFVKNHRKQKILVFLSSCKQVRYVHEAFKRLKIANNLLALYGTLHQLKRMSVYESFCRKESVVLLATDIAARGLDFPDVNWVVQLDCPENANEYIHRAGRTARYRKTGESLLVLLPSESKMIEHLQKKKIPISEICINTTKLQSIQRGLEAQLARDHNFKEMAQRAFISYIKSVFFMKDKEVFDVLRLDTDAFARSLGLAVVPRIRFLKNRGKVRENKRQIENENVNNPIGKSEAISYEKTSLLEEMDPSKEPSKVVDSRKTPLKFYDDNENTDDFLFVKRKNHELDTEELCTEELERNALKKTKKPTTRAAQVKKILKKKILPNKKIVFNEQGEVVVQQGKEYVSELAKQYETANEAGIDISTAKRVLFEEDKYDKELFRKKIKEKHREERWKLKEERSKAIQSDGALLGSGSENENSNDEISSRLSYTNAEETSDDSEADYESDCAVNSRKLCVNKRKLEMKCEKSLKKQRKWSMSNANSDDDAYSLQGAEELALKLINMKNKGN